MESVRSLLPARKNGPSVQVELHSAATPEQAAHLLHQTPGFIWLDGSTTRHYLFAEPIAQISSDGKTAQVTTAKGSTQFAASSLEALGLMTDLEVDSPNARLAGYIAYDVAAELEQIGNLLPEPNDIPRMRFGLYESFLTFDAGRWFLFLGGGWSDESSIKPRTNSWQNLLDRAETASLPDLWNTQLAATLIPDKSAEHRFVHSVENIVDRIGQGDFFQTNLCRRLEASVPSGSEWPLYLRMRHLSPARYAAFQQWGDGHTVLSVSPELFLRVKDRHVVSEPIKGTRPRGADLGQDIALQQDLLQSSKDRAELAMIVDVTRNDLSRVCKTGSVRVVEHASMMTLPTLHHTFSQVAGQLKDGTTSADLIRAAFPPASITGAPKIAAMQAALREEQRTRGVCMGGIGWLSLNGDLELSVAIRTASTQNGTLHYLTGCGITSDSSPAAELEESRVKAAALLKALE
jgi:para-aminobenzoate synthetase component I